MGFRQRWRDKGTLLDYMRPMDRAAQFALQRPRPSRSVVLTEPLTGLWIASALSDTGFCWLIEPLEPWEVFTGLRPGASYGPRPSISTGVTSSMERLKGFAQGVRGYRSAIGSAAVARISKTYTSSSDLRGDGRRR
jgi:hypothetical protein